MKRQEFKKLIKFNNQHYFSLKFCLMEKHFKLIDSPNLKSSGIYKVNAKANWTMHAARTIFFANPQLSDMHHLPFP